MTRQEPTMTQTVRYTQPTQAELDTIMAEARQLRSDMIAAAFRGLGVRIRGLFAAGKPAHA
ncbi:hypothetical protein SAMN04488567_3099 [Limimaricola pyoseonensis]|uniref:Uncharacterized protein n=2 Tax=Limimaricola pyoseonensis TaxID=521013 RepID=A0A1G7H7C8_9RHOB|nr:hypothetical protein SAMN04488567_3099 [Limimaricola pyoseonensis]